MKCHARLSSFGRSRALGLAKRLEATSAIVQGKGWGAGSIQAEVRACCSLLSSVKVFIDIGANKGDYTDEVLKHFPDIECHLFEPSSYNLELLQQRFHSFSNVHVVGKALSDTENSQTLFTNEPGSGLASLSKRRLEHFGIEMSISEEIQTQRFDQYWSADSEVRIDFVKIDVEGHEMQVLNGFGKCLAQVKLIQFEFGGCNIDTRTFFQDFWYFFAEHGFRLFRISPLGLESIDWYSENLECFRTTNYIALNKREIQAHS